MYYDLFKSCFPEMDVSEAAFSHMLKLPAQTVLEHWEGKTLAGFAMLERNMLRLLCVLPEYQGKGIGTALLSRAEKAALQAGEKKMIIGGTGPTRLFIGAPEKAKGFFEKQGYTMLGHFDEMKGDLSAFRASDFSLPTPAGASFGWYRGDWKTLQKAVAEVDEDWVQYFQEGQKVFCGMLDGEITSFCAVEEWENCLLSNGHNRVGAPGCVGTVPKFRRKGIGLKMVALACEELKKQGCDTCYIHYTGVAPWYAHLGFRVFLTQYFCEKAL